nr:probable folate-biopterin transporter 8, chloroplastic [Ipomoea batatas]
MISALRCNGNPVIIGSSRIQTRRKTQSLLHSKLISCAKNGNPSYLKGAIDKYWRAKFDKQLININPIVIDEEGGGSLLPDKPKKRGVVEEKGAQLGRQQMMVLCGFGYWVQGFRAFPWLALNFHMAHGMKMHPSTLQLVQNSGNLPFVAKPLYGILSDALYIGGDHRLPYISIGVFLQVLAWGQLAIISSVSEAIPALMACVLLSNLGASITEVAKDALVAEYGQKNEMPGIQSYAFMASAAGGMLANLLGGYFLMKTKQPSAMFQAFTALLAVQLAMSLSMREESLGLAEPSKYTVLRKSIPESIKRQFSDLMVAIRDESIYRPLIWIVVSILAVPVLSGSIFCYQTQSLNLDPSIIGLSKVTGQLMLLSMTVLYHRFGKNIPMRKLSGIIQILYAGSLLLDLVLIKQFNINLGIPNEVFALCFSGIAETISSFKLLPFYVLIASSAPSGCEGSLMSFLASALCLSSIISGFLGIGLASFLGITSGNYTSLPVGIIIQFLAALLPLGWLKFVPMSLPSAEKERKIDRSKRRSKNRRAGKVVLRCIYPDRQERQSDLQR